ncbi:MAG: DUF58 domain-containing protein [Mycobacteriales bacterium]
MGGDRLHRIATGLTPRGQGFLVAGATSLILGLAVGQTDLVRVAVFLLVAPLAALAVVGSTRLTISARRELAPARTVAGEPCRVTVSVANSSRLPCGRLFFEDRLPYQLGGSPRFCIEALAAGHSRSVSYTLRCESRGRYRIGPLSLRITDPFGLCQLRRLYRETHELLVLPSVQALPVISLSGEWSGEKQARPRFLAAAGQDDVTPRPYRRGDDVRRVHWRSTARLGELTVRREEQPWQPRAALLLDTRACAHEGEGVHSSFEYAITAFASIACHFEGRGFGVRATTDEATSLRDTAGLLDALAGLGQSKGRRLSPGLNALASRPGENVTIVITGRLFEDDLAALADCHPVAGQGIVVLLDTWTWREFDQRSALRASAAEQTTRLLRELGYSVLRAPRGTDLAAAWSQLRRPVRPVSGVVR